MHPLLILLAFTLAAVVTYVLVLGVLTALSIPKADPEGEADGEIDGQPAPDRAAWGEHARL